MNKFTKFSQPLFFALLCLTLMTGGQAFGQIDNTTYFEYPYFVDNEGVTNTVVDRNIRLLANSDGYDVEGIIFAGSGQSFSADHYNLFACFDQAGVLQLNPVTNDYYRKGMIHGRPDGEKLFVYGGSTIEGPLRIRANSFPDYVFAHNYDLMPLGELDAYIQKNKHLPKVPKAKRVIKEGMNVAQMNVLLVEKIEEITLYTIDQHKQIEQLMKKVKTLETLLKK